ncbi:hypothetical protein JCM8547_006718 [Rhodosporidiobolus lusitaniae]
MAEPPEAHPLVTLFPQLDSALVYAILSDFSLPLSQQDETSARAVLESLAADAELADPDFGQIGVAQDTHTGSTSSSRNTSRDGQDDAQSQAVSVSEISSRLEQASLGSDVGGEGGSAMRETIDEAEGSLPAGQAFWEASGASLTSEEDSAQNGNGVKFVWDGPDVDEIAYGDFLDVGDDPLAFLASVFPDMDIAVLEGKLAGTLYADGTPADPVDLEALVEELLNQDLISEMHEEDEKAAWESAAAREKEQEKESAPTRQQKKRLKATQKAHNSFSLTSTPHLPSPASCAGTNTPALEVGPSSSHLQNAFFASNAWVSASSNADYLAPLLRIPQARIISTYNQHHSSLPATLSVLLSQLAHDRPFSSLPSGLDLKAQLATLIPSSSLTSLASTRSREDELETLLCATEGDISNALDLHVFVADVQRQLAGGKALSWSTMVGKPAVETVQEKTEKRLSGGYTTISNSRRRATPETSHIPLPFTSSSHSSSLLHLSSSHHAHYSASDCRRFALEALEKRNEAFREAARAFQRGHGRGVERGGATVWAEKGRGYERERRRWEEEGARRTVGERKLITGKDVIDLHGLTLSQALTVVDDACNDWWSSSRCSFSPTPLRIITGVGRHSRNQRAVLAPAVTRHLDKNGWRWKWDDGPLVARGMPLKYAGGADGPGRGAVKVIGVR